MDRVPHPALSPREFKLFQDLIREESGIIIQNVKHRLLQVKLSRRITEKGFRTFSEYYRHLVGHDHRGDELHELLDLITTNKTEFFREPGHFHYLRETVLPGLASLREKDPAYFLRFWSAGCATGEEAYSLAIALTDFFGAFPASDGRILATDISTSALKHGMAGVYSRRSIAAPAAPFVAAHLERVNSLNGPAYRVRRELRDLVEFRRLNLVTGVFPFKYGFDVIFCRNVMIYFEKSKQRTLINRLTGALREGGYLFTGHTENLLDIEGPFERVRASVFRKTAAIPARPAS